MAALHAISLLPLDVLYVVSSCLYPIVYHLWRYRRKTVRRNIARSFPEKELREIILIEKGYYRHFCDCVVETVKMLHISDKELDRHVQVANGGLIEQYASDGRPIILYLGHYGNWEWVQAITRHYNCPAVSGEIYRPMHDKVMEKVMRRLRSRFPTLLIPQKQAFRTLLRMKREGKQCLVGFIADQRPNSKSLNHWTTFLHQDTAYSIGGEEIGNRINAHFFYLDVEKVRRGCYKMSFVPITPQRKDETHPYTLQYMRMMEATITRAPQYWLWSHKRWRFPKADSKNNK